MSDHGEISSLIARLAWKVDHQEHDDYLDYWEPDGELVYIGVDGNRFECKGSAQVLELIKNSYTPPHHPCLHIVTNPIIEVNGDEGVARYYTIHTLHGPLARPVGVGEYETRVRRGKDGKWRVTLLYELQKLDYEQVAGSSVPPRD